MLDVPLGFSIVDLNGYNVYSLNLCYVCASRLRYSRTNEFAEMVLILVMLDVPLGFYFFCYTRN